MAILTDRSKECLAAVSSSKQLRVTERKHVAHTYHFLTSGLTSAAQTAHTVPTQGFMWVVNPVGASWVVVLDRVNVTSVSIANSAAAIRVQMEKFTYSGAPTAVALTSCPRDTTDGTPAFTGVTATTGMAIDTPIPWFGFFLTSGITAAKTAVPVALGWESRGQTAIYPGEGLWFRQPDTGVASDPRKFSINMAWREYLLD